MAHRGPVMMQAEKGVGSAGRGTPRTAGRAQKPEEASRTLREGLRRGHSTADTLTSEFWPPDYEMAGFRCFKLPCLGHLLWQAQDPHRGLLQVTPSTLPG